MAHEATYTTEVAWKGEHWGHLVMGNGPEMDFSAPPDAHGHAGVLTPEDAFVAAANTCVMMMFLWACERFKLDLVSFRCRTEARRGWSLTGRRCSPISVSGRRSRYAPPPMRMSSP